MRSLVAEDDIRLLKSLVHIFETNHYSVDGVSNGADAYEYASSGEYDGLVLVFFCGASLPRLLSRPLYKWVGV